MVTARLVCGPQAVQYTVQWGGPEV